VIWMSDMRGFTAWADSIAPRLLIELLNRYFDCQVPAILDHGGEIVKFMGDGLLAIFPEAITSRRSLPPRARRRPGRTGERRCLAQPTGGWHCIWARFSTAISAAATLSISPASVRPSTSPRASRNWQTLYGG